MPNTTKMTPLNEETNIEPCEIEDIKQKIYTIRGKQVMLDSDIAKLYEVETRVVNQAVKRNVERFPDEFCFQLKKEEYSSLKSQIVISKGGRRKIPYVFTEQGVAMLSAVLHSPKAIKSSIKIIKAFIEMRKFIVNNKFLFQKISNIELKQIEYQKSTDDKFEKVYLPYWSIFKRLRKEMFWNYINKI